MNRTTLRKARRYRSCASSGTMILPGDLYLEHVCSPDHDDVGNVGWWRAAECRECAERYGRGHLFGGAA